MPTFLPARISSTRVARPMSLSASAVAPQPVARTYASNRARKAAATCEAVTGVGGGAGTISGGNILPNGRNVNRKTRRVRVSRFAATFPGMPDPTPVPAAFQSLLDERGQSLSGLASKIGDPNALAKVFAREPRSMRSHTLLKLAALLEIPVDDLARIMGLAGVGPPVGATGRGLTLPVRYIVQAGAYYAEDLDAQAFRKRLPVGPDPRFPVPQWLEEVRGDSVDEIIPDGGYAQVADWVSIGADLRDGMLVVARALRDGGLLAERTVKEVRRKGRKLELWPRSRNPRWSAPVLVADPERPAESENGDEISVVGLVVQSHVIFPA